jgi:hypothetical protein
MFLSVPDTPRPVSWQHRLRFDTLDPVLTYFKPLRQIPQKKVDKHAAGTRWRAPVRAQSRGDTFHSDDRRGAYGDLLSRTGRKFFVRLKGTDERGSVGEYSEVVEDLRDAIICEHGELADTVWEEWM